MTDTIDSAPTTAPVKPGYKTTEFYFGGAATLLTLLYASGLLTSNVSLAIAGMVATVLTALGYKVSRTIVKAAAVLLVVLGLGATQLSCATLKAVPAAGKTAAIECAKESAAPILTLALALAEQAALAVIDQGGIDWPAIEGAAAVEGKVLGGCAFKKFVAGLSTAPRSDTAVRSLVAGPDPVADGRAAIARLSARFGGATWQ